MVTSIGAICFGIVIGYVTYRTLVRKDDSSISDIAAVIAAVGGAAVTQLFDPATGDSFGYYAIGLLIGMATFLALRITLERPADVDPPSNVLGDKEARSAEDAVLGDSGPGHSRPAILGD